METEACCRVSWTTRIIGYFSQIQKREKEKGREIKGNVQNENKNQ